MLIDDTLNQKYVLNLITIASRWIGQDYPFQFQLLNLPQCHYVPCFDTGYSDCCVQDAKGFWRLETQKIVQLFSSITISRWMEPSLNKIDAAKF